MATRTAYGQRGDIADAIKNLIIPKDSIIITNDSQKNGELFFYDADGTMVNIKERTRFDSLEEATSWAKQYDCAGSLFTVYSGETYSVYLVGKNGTLNPFPSTSANMNLITSVNEGEFVVEEGKLSVKEISMGKINGLADALKNIKNGVTSIRIDDTEFHANEEGCVEIPRALLLGVTSNPIENGIVVDEDGAMSVSSLNVNKLTQTDGEVLIFDCGAV